MDEKRIYKVYMYTCKDNGKIYIGQTCTTIENRAKKDGVNYKECSYFWNAICAHGWDNFECKILLNGLTKEEANHWEEYYIRELNSTDRNIGYNLTYGGDGNIPTEEVKQKMRDHHANFVGENHHNSKQIYLLNTCEVFGSSLEASQAYNVNRNSILENCRGKIRYAGVLNGVPLQWCFYDEKDDKIFNCNLKIHGGTLYKRSVYCLTTKECFNSVADASKRYNVAESSIRQNINKKRRYAGVLDDGRTLQWCDLKDKDLYEYNPNIKPINMYTNHTVYCFELNTVFDNSKIAEKHTGVRHQQINSVCSNKKGFKTAGGMHWSWYDKNNNTELLEVIPNV